MVLLAMVSLERTSPWAYKIPTGLELPTIPGKERKPFLLQPQRERLSIAFR